ncbi:MAG: PAS domain-containing protein [Proteobacteria bacterium]|jgi:PAS domain S-box-containing protein|nr:PAS domain-containing protein [Pseudomonadota bacterium]
MRDITLEDLNGASGARHELRFHDGSTRAVYVVEREVPFPEGALIVSRTDTRGVITHANQAFVEMSGYDEAELIGEQHCILRHPDMPAAAFQGLWDTLARGEKWHGYVKNLRKDGAFYWVYATVVPNRRGGQVVGYTSVRRKPARSRIAAAEALYRTL